MVCNHCHKALGGGLSVGATGEFRIPTPAELDDDYREAPVVGERPAAVNVCSWCGKLEPQVKKLLGRGGVALCNECVSLCCDILDAEVENWR